MRKQNGFTLIELMIVVAIVGILAAIAIPAYKDFQVRSKVSEVLAAMGACKTTVGEFYQSNNGWTTRSGNPIDADICQDTNEAIQSAYLESMTVNATGVILATTRDTGANPEGTIEMSPTDEAGAAVVPPAPIKFWACGTAGTTLAARYRPGSCQQ